MPTRQRQVPASLHPGGDIFEVRRRAYRIAVAGDGEHGVGNRYDLLPQVRAGERGAAADVAVRRGGGEGAQNAIDGFCMAGCKLRAEPAFGRGRGAAWS